MGETGLETKESRRSPAEQLIDVGEKIKSFSSKEVENKKAITALSLVGLASVGAIAANAGYADKIGSLADELMEMDQPAGAALLYRESANAWAMGSLYAFALAAELGTLVGVENLRFLRKGDSILFLSDKTKVSTHVLPALGEVFIRIGRHFSEK